MTSRCEQQRSKQNPWHRLVFGLAVSLAFAVAASASAQDEGTRVPPPPQLKHKHPTIPDADFHSPLKQAGQPGTDIDNEPPFNQRNRFRRRQAEGPGFGDTAGDGGPGQFGGRMGLGQFGQGRQGQFRQGAGDGLPGGGRFGEGLAGRRRQQGPAMGGLGMLGGGRHALDLTSLNLSDEQKQKIRQIHQNTRERVHDVRSQLVQKQMQLRTLLFSPDASEVKIRAARKELRRVQDQLDDLNMDDLIGIRSVLTAEQRQKLPDIAPPLPQAAGGLGPGGGAAIGQRREP